MTLALRYAVRSDVGLLREGNEDSAYAGPHLLAVADGMGGHAAGEVASSATITTISSLDSERPGIDLVSALAEAVAMANMRLQELVISDPATEGMGTTLTAMLWLDGHAALCHIGDSRAYLLRAGSRIERWDELGLDDTTVMVEAFAVKVACVRAALHATSEIFDLTGARSTAGKYRFDRFWRNARNFSTHDPTDAKEVWIGDWHLNGKEPPFIAMLRV